MSNAARETYTLDHLNKNDFISELYHRYGKKLYAYAIHTWKVSEDEAWDLIYRTLYKVIDSYRKHTFENEEKFASYVFRIFINDLRNHYRDHKKAAMVVTGIEDEDLQNKPEPQANEQTQNARMHLLREELDKMEDWQRILLLMRSDGRPYSEIAKYVDKPEEQLKVYYQRLKKLITDKIYERL